MDYTVDCTGIKKKARLIQGEYMKKLSYSIIVSIILIVIYIFLNYITNGWIDKNVPDPILTVILVVLILIFTNIIYKNNSEIPKKK